jgi:hypothetical protein
MYMYRMFLQKYYLNANGTMYNECPDLECDRCGHKASEHLDGMDVCLNRECICEKFAPLQRNELKIPCKTILSPGQQMCETPYVQKLSTDRLSYTFNGIIRH